MKKWKPAPHVLPSDPRTADEFIRDWCEHMGSVAAAERAAGMVRDHLHVWLNDPDRRLNPASTLKLSRAANIPIEALMFRWTPIRELDLWKWTKAG